MDSLLNSVDDEVLEALAGRLGASLAARGLVLATAESCTGGWLGQCVTAISGSSAWYDRGFITYSNEAKKDLLGVAGQTLAAHGAVSLETAREMALGALRHSRALVAVSTTGVAGPTGGTPINPVGTVCFAWAMTGSKSTENPAPETVVDGATICHVERRHLSGGRELVRRQSVVIALEGLIRMIET